MIDDKFAKITCICDRCGRTDTVYYLKDRDPSTVAPEGWSMVNRTQFGICGDVDQLLDPYKLCNNCSIRLKLWLDNPKDYDEFDKDRLSVYRSIQHLKMHEALGDFERWNKL